MIYDWKIDKREKKSFKDPFNRFQDSNRRQDRGNVAEYVKEMERRIIENLDLKLFSIRRRLHAIKVCRFILVFLTFFLEEELFCLSEPNIDNFSNVSTERE